jgi:ParB-like chromosome segregation protein Spo0J
MQIENWPIDRPKDYPQNARVITDESVSKMAELLREYGICQPLVVDKAGTILVGHRRRRAWKLLGNTEIPVYIAGHLTAKQARAYRMADNRSALDVGTNFDALRHELTALHAEAFDLALTGYETYEIAPLMALDQGDDTPEAPEGGDGEAPPKMRALKFTADQYEFLESAAERLREATDDKSIKLARAIELIAADWLAGV